MQIFDKQTTPTEYNKDTSTPRIHDTWILGMTLLVGDVRTRIINIVMSWAYTTHHNVYYTICV